MFSIIFFALSFDYPLFKSLAKTVNSQEKVEGKVKLKLYKGNTIITGRESSLSLYDTKLATFEEDNIFTQKDAEGFIKLNALRLRKNK